MLIQKNADRQPVALQRISLMGLVAQQKTVKLQKRTPDQAGLKIYREKQI